METEAKTGLCTNLKAVLATKDWGSNDYNLSVIGTIKAGPEKIDYTLKPIMPADFNPMIVALEIVPDPTDGDVDHPIKYLREYEGMPNISEVRIKGRGNSCNIIIDKPIN
jgi:hypothetical protein